MANVHFTCDVRGAETSLFVAGKEIRVPSTSCGCLRLLAKFNGEKYWVLHRKCRSKFSSVVTFWTHGFNNRAPVTFVWIPFRRETKLQRMVGERQSSERLFYLFYFQHPCFICFIFPFLVKSVLFLFYLGIFCFILGKIGNLCNIFYILM